MQKISQEDIAFLKALQHEMLTQDKVCQAAPRFWVVRGTIRTYGIAHDYADAVVLRMDEGICIESMKEAYDYLTEHYSDTICKIKYCESDNTITYCDDTEEESEEEHEGYDYILYDLSDVNDFLYKQGENEAELVGYQEIDKIYENTMFITLKECRAHIKANYYHYPEDAHPYAMTAWRSPQIEKLWNILEQTNWDEIK